MGIHFWIALARNFDLIAGYDNPALIIADFLEVICRYEQGERFAVGVVSSVELDVQKQIFVALVAELSNEGSLNQEAFPKGYLDGENRCVVSLQKTDS